MTIYCRSALTLPIPGGRDVCPREGVVVVPVEVLHDALHASIDPRRVVLGGALGGIRGTLDELRRVGGWVGKKHEKTKRSHY